MSNVSIIGKFLGIIGAFGLFALCSAVFSTSEMSRIGHNFSQLIEGQTAASIDLGRASQTFQAAHAAIGDLLMETTPSANQTELDQVNQNLAKTDDDFAQAQVLSPDEASAIGALKARIDQVLNVTCAQTIKDADASSNDATNAAVQKVYLRDCQPAFALVSEDTLSEVEKLKQSASAGELSLNHNTASTVMMTYGIVLGGLLAVMVGGFFAMRAWVITPIKTLQAQMAKISGGDYEVLITGRDRKDEIGGMARAVQVFKEAGLEKLRVEEEARTQRLHAEEERARNEAEREVSARSQEMVVGAIASGLEKLSTGDLIVRLATPFSGEYEKLRGDFNVAMDKLQDTMKAIAANTQGVRSGAEEITQASDDLSRRTEQQAASLEQTAAALDEITATVRKTAEGANAARNVVATAKTDAERSGEVVRETVSAMSGIETSSKQIGNIIGVIDEIAFQTNLLALNAGVEAARAGDAGRGFAVVATEVRALAQRSAEAAKEIKALISASSQQVESGVKLVGETGKALGRIVEQVTQLNGLVVDIAASAQEQATGLNEVNTAVNQMDQVTQQNAAMVEQSTAASHSLAGEASELARLIGQFQIGQFAEPLPTPKPPVRKTSPVGKSRIPVHAPAPSGKYNAARANGAARPVMAASAESAENWDEF